MDEGIGSPSRRARAPHGLLRLADRARIVRGPARSGKPRPARAGKCCRHFTARRRSRPVRLAVGPATGPGTRRQKPGRGPSGGGAARDSKPRAGQCGNSSAGRGTSATSACRHAIGARSHATGCARLATRTRASKGDCARGAGRYAQTCGCGDRHARRNAGANGSRAIASRVRRIAVHGPSTGEALGGGIDPAREDFGVRARGRCGQARIHGRPCHRRRQVRCAHL